MPLLVAAAVRTEAITDTANQGNRNWETEPPPPKKKGKKKRKKERRSKARQRGIKLERGPKINTALTVDAAEYRSRVGG